MTPDLPTLLRSISVTFEDGSVLSLWAVRAPGAGGHGEEALAALLLDAGQDDPVPVVEPLLSTEYDGEGNHRRATLELHMSEEGPPLRGSGTRVSGGSLELGAMVLETALFHWSVESRKGIGRYDIWRDPSA